MGRAAAKSIRALLAASLAMVGGRARAQPADPEQLPVAQALVDEGRRLLADGKPEEACPKFKEAVRVAPSWGIGALAQLAECYEKAGRLAGAWGTWVQVESAARTAGQAERAQAAHERVAALAPRVPRLTLVVKELLRGQEGVEITRDGAAIPREQWGVSIPVDPGRHLVRVTAPRRIAWAVEIDVRAGEVQIVAPARLEEAPAPVAPARVTPTQPQREDDPGKVQRRVGIGVGVAGIIALEAALVLIVMNATDAADYRAVCPGPITKLPICGTANMDPGGLLAGARATQVGAIASGVAGVVALGSGIAIYTTAPAPGRGTTRAPPGGTVAAVLGLGGAAMRVRW